VLSSERALQFELAAILICMSNNLLVRYIKTVLESVKDARVPNQLLDAPDSEKEKKDEVEDVNEFSGVGAIAGYTAPLGADPGAMGRKKNAAKRKKK